MDLYVSLLLIAELALALWLLHRQGLIKKPNTFFCCFAALLIAFSLRLLFIEHRSGDYNDFLVPWVEFFRYKGGFAGLGQSVGNYNPPYLYFLALFSYFDVEPLYLIKLTSILFDVLLAWVSMKITEKCGGGNRAQIFAFLGVLLLPTVILNGACWAQCDSIYVFFGLLALYFAMDERPCLSLAALALSLSFKLQAVFIMPLWFVLLLCKKIKPWQLFIFPAAYALVLLPPMLAGRPPLEVLTVYFNQAGTVGDALNYNSASLFSIIGWNITDTALWSKLAVGMAFFFVLLVFVFAYTGRKSMTNPKLLGFALLFVIGIPFLLPHMHDRYFYFADILSFILVCVSPEFFLVPCLAEFASFQCYYAYLNLRYLIHPRYAGIAMALALAGTLIYLLWRNIEGKKKKTQNNS